MIDDKISSCLKSNNKSSLKYSNLVGFLLSDISNFINKTNYSDHLRDIIASLMTNIKEEILLNEVVKFLKDFILELIEVLLSSKWDEIVRMN